MSKPVCRRSLMKATPVGAPSTCVSGASGMVKRTERLHRRASSASPDSSTGEQGPVPSRCNRVSHCGTRTPTHSLVELAVSQAGPALLETGQTSARTDDPFLREHAGPPPAPERQRQASACPGITRRNAPSRESVCHGDPEFVADQPDGFELRLVLGSAGE